MRRLVIILVVLAALLGVPAIASAANCSFGANAAYIGNKAGQTGVSSNVIWSAASIFNCTSVSAVRWANGGLIPDTPSPAGFYDDTLGGGTSAKGYYEPTPNYDGGAQEITLDNPGPGTNVRFVSNITWFLSQCRFIRSVWYAQIKNSVTNTWGSRVKVVSPSVLTCHP